MELSFEHPEGFLFVRRTGERSVTLIDRELTESFLLTPEKAVEAWPVQAADSLGADHVEALLALEPEVVILGTGARQVFPAAAFMAGFLARGIGVEVMNNAAAARTYNLLASEGRHVLAAFILEA